MKQKLKELGAKLQTKKGSILVYTLIIMMVMLATAISIATVAVRERKGSGTTAQSNQAFAVADSGSEIALHKIAVGSGDLSGIITDCGSNQLAGDIGTGKDYVVTFYDSGGDQLTCSDSISDVDKVKSVGRYAGTARAVEVAVAQTGDCVDGVQIVASDTTASFVQGDFNDIKEFIADGGHILGAFCDRGSTNAQYIGSPSVTFTGAQIQIQTFLGGVICSFPGTCNCSSGWQVFGACTCERSC